MLITSEDTTTRTNTLALTTKHVSK